jgi:hypothetical protein
MSARGVHGLRSSCVEAALRAYEEVGPDQHSCWLATIAPAMPSAPISAMLRLSTWTATSAVFAAAAEYQVSRSPRLLGENRAPVRLQLVLHAVPCPESDR